MSESEKCRDDVKTQMTSRQFLNSRNGVQRNQVTQFESNNNNATSGSAKLTSQTCVEFDRNLTSNGDRPWWLDNDATERLKEKRRQTKLRALRTASMTSHETNRYRKPLAQVREHETTNGDCNVLDLDSSGTDLERGQTSVNNKLNDSWSDLEVGVNGNFYFHSARTKRQNQVRSSEDESEQEFFV